MLGHNFASACRLNAQHYVWQQELGFALHPDIPLPKNGDRIADVAAGTGAWLLETARAFPNVQFDGFDISLSQCPVKACLPSNVSFTTWNMFEEPPTEVVGKYDVVHLRLVILVIQGAATSPIPILTGIAKMLKPGGYLQWDELDVTHSVVFPDDGTLKVNALKRLDAAMKSSSAMKWLPELPKMANDNGFEGAKYYQILPRLELMTFNIQTTLLTYVERANSVQDPESKKRFMEMAEEIWEETQQGASHANAKAVIVARKRF